MTFAACPLTSIGTMRCGARLGHPGDGGDRFRQAGVDGLVGRLDS